MGEAYRGICYQSGDLSQPSNELLIVPLRRANRRRQGCECTLRCCESRNDLCRVGPTPFPSLDEGLCCGAHVGGYIRRHYGFMLLVKSGMRLYAGWRLYVNYEAGVKVLA